MNLVDLKSEKIVLASLLARPILIDSALSLVSEENFTVPEYKLVLKALVDLDTNQKPINKITLVSKLESFGVTEGKCYDIVADISGGFAVPEAIRDYCQNLRSAKNARTLFNAVEHAKTQIEFGDDVKDVITSLNLCLESFDEPDEKTESDLGSDIDEEIELILKRVSGEITHIGYSTGISEIDRWVICCKGDLIVIGARPGGGKSVMLSQIRRNMIEKYGIRTGFISLEMSRDQMSRRVIASLTSTPLGQIQGKDPFFEGKIDEIKSLRGKYPKGDHPISYKTDLNIQSIRSIARRWKRQNKIDALFVDYTQLIDETRGTKKSRNETVAEISRGLKTMAMELDIPVFAASQLNRSSEEDDVPSLRHLKESGAIEQDADIVFLLFENKDDNGQTQNHCVIAKNRNGACNLVKISFHKAVQIIS